MGRVTRNNVSVSAMKPMISESITLIKGRIETRKNGIDTTNLVSLAASQSNAGQSAAQKILSTARVSLQTAHQNLGAIVKHSQDLSNSSLRLANNKRKCS